MIGEGNPQIQLTGNLSNLDHLYKALSNLDPDRDVEIIWYNNLTRVIDSTGKSYYAPIKCKVKEVKTKVDELIRKLNGAG